MLKTNSEISQIKRYHTKLGSAMNKIIDQLYFLLRPEMKEFLNKIGEIEKIKSMLLEKEIFFNSIPSAITAKDLDGKYIWVSKYLLERLNIQPEMIIGKTDEQIEVNIASKYGKRVTEKRDIGCGVVEYQLQIPTDYGFKYILMREIPFKDVKGVLIGYILVGSDITKIKELEAKLTISEENKTQILENIPDGIGYIDASFKIQEINKALCSIFEGTQKEIEGANIYGFFNNIRIARHIRKKLFTDGCIENIEMEINTLKGNKKWIILGASYYSAKNRIIFSIKDITDLKEAQKKIEKMAYYSSLTDLPNRQLLIDILKSTLARVHRHSINAELMWLDLDGFKKINDTYGHLAGDKILFQVGERIKKVIRESDTIAHIGGDEFAVLITDLRMPQDSGIVAKKILNEFSKPFDVKGDLCNLGVSIGISIIPGTMYNIDNSYDWDQEVDKHLKRADAAMYNVKTNGKSGVCFFDEKKFQEDSIYIC